MFTGHLGVGLMFKRIAPSFNLGILFLAAMFLNVILWALVLLHIEFLYIPANFRKHHYFTFSFPYSHGLIASLLWPLLVGPLFYWLRKGRASLRWNVPIVVALVVYSHFILDFLVQLSEMPVVSSSSVQLGLGLWENLPFALGLETAIVLAGVYLGIRSSALPRPSKLFIV
jgi:hypothetical protein